MYRSKAIPKCMQGYELGECVECGSGNKCDSCGWNEDEYARRNASLLEDGLTLCSDMLYRFIIPARV